MAQLSSFGCVHLSHQGRLCTSPTELYFISAFYRADILWSDVVGIEIIAKNHNGKPISILSVKTRGSTLHFHSFRDIQSAGQQLRKCLQRPHNQQIDSIPQGEIAIEPELSEKPDTPGQIINASPPIVAKSNRNKHVILGVLVVAFGIFFAIPSSTGASYLQVSSVQSAANLSWWTECVLLSSVIVLVAVAVPHVSSDFFR